MAVNLGDSMGVPPPAHIHDGDQLPGESPGGFRLEWTHTFGAICIEVRAGVVYVDGQPVVPALNTLAPAPVASSRE